jgi:hypothetical protein
MIDEARRYYSRAGHEAIRRVLYAQIPDYQACGFVYDFPTDANTGAPLTDRQLQDYALEVMSSPSESGEDE